MSIILDGTNGITSVTGSASLCTAGPAFSVYLATTSQSVSTGVTTKVAFNTKIFDTNSNFDVTTNYRFTPTVAGYYLISGAILYDGSVSGSLFSTSIWKNGSQVNYNQLGISTTTLNNTSNPVTAVIYLNGSTDYVELYGYNNIATNPKFDAGIGATYMTGCLLRSA